MKVEVENQPQGVATLRIELPPEDVRKEWDAIAGNYSRYARIPGYRPGKAPRQVIEKKFRKEIQDELTKALVSKSYHEAIAEKQLRVVSLTDVGDVEFGEDRSMRFRATVVTAPEFELPEYKNIPVELPATMVNAAEVDAAIERLREQTADFVDAGNRELAMGDYAVLDFTGAIDGVPISEIVPEASKNLHGGKKFWLHLAPENFLPKFCEQIVGMKAGDTRSVQVEFPAEFPVTELAGKRADYAVTLDEIKEKVLPPADDEFARAASEFDTYAELQNEIESRLREQLEDELDAAFRAEAVDRLVEASNATASGPLVEARSRELLNQLGRSLDRRGISADLYLQLTGQTPEQLAEGVRAEAAQSVARELVLEAAADKLGIEVSDDEVEELIREQAEAAGEDPADVLSQLREAGRQRTRPAADVECRPTGAVLEHEPGPLFQVVVDYVGRKRSVVDPCDPVKVGLAHGLSR